MEITIVIKLKRFTDFKLQKLLQKIKGCCYIPTKKTCSSSLIV